MKTIKKYLSAFFNFENFNNGLLVFAASWLLCVLVREFSYLLRIDEFVWTLVGIFVIFLLGFLFRIIVNAATEKENN